MQKLLFAEEEQSAKLRSKVAELKELQAQTQTEMETLLVDKQRAVIAISEKAEKCAEQVEALKADLEKQQVRDRTEYGRHWRYGRGRRIQEVMLGAASMASIAHHARA